MLTAQGAENTLMSMLKPQLDEMRPQMQMMVGMFSGMLSSGIQQDENLSSEQKRKAGKLVQAIGNFLSENDLTDERNARKAVGVVCTTARKLNINSIEQFQAMNFNQMLGKADIALAGAKDLFSIYGMDFDQWIDGLEVQTVSQDGDTAVVRVSYEIFGVKDTVDEELVRRGSRWISTKTEQALLGR